jgi:hypothetical protein
VPRDQRDGSLWPYPRIFRPEPLISLLSSSSIVIYEAERTPFQTRYFSENLVAPGIEPGPLDLQPGTLTTRPQTRSQLLHYHVFDYDYIRGLHWELDLLTTYITRNYTVTTRPQRR